MGTLATAFALAGIAIACYATWLGREQQRLRRRLDALEAMAPEESDHKPLSRAA
jgi:CcmD family protein